MPKALSAELPNHDLFSTYCTTSASTHKYSKPIRPANHIPTETGFTKNVEHHLNDPRAGQHNWHSTYTDSHNESGIKQNREGHCDLHPKTNIELSSFSKQNCSSFQTASYAGVQSESRSAYSDASMRQNSGTIVKTDEFKCSENGYTRNFVIDQDRLKARFTRTPHSEFEDRYQSPAIDTNIDTSRCHALKTISSMSGYSKSCIAPQQSRYGTDLNTIMKSSYGKKSEHWTARLPIECDSKSADMSGYVSNTSNQGNHQTEGNRHCKGLVGNRYFKEGNIELYATPKLSTEPARLHPDMYQYHLTPSPQETTITQPPIATKADLSQKLTHWKAS